MCIEATERIRSIQVTRWILFNHDIYSTPHGRSTELGWNHTFIYFNAVNHVDGYIVDVDEIGIIVHRYFVYKESNTLAFQAANRDTRGTAYCSLRTNGYAYGLSQNIFYAIYCTL